MDPNERLDRIARIIEAVDHRCQMADGPVTPTLKEMTQEEISEIYKLATEMGDGDVVCDTCGEKMIYEILTRCPKCTKDLFS